MKKITLFSLFIFFGAIIAIYLVSVVSNKSIVFFFARKQIQDNSFVASSSVSDIGSGLTLSRVASHSRPDDCYLVINNKVYDVSSYINQHPGGRRNIISRCGKEVTGIFASIHSNFAWDLLSNYYVGNFSGDSSVLTKNVIVSSNPVVLSSIEQSLKRAYPGSDILFVKPKKDFFVAKMIKDNKLFEAHIDSSGKILQFETENEEFDWGNFDQDNDDN